MFTGEFCKTSRHKNLYTTETSTEKGKEKSIQIHFGEAIDLKKKKSLKKLAQNLNYNYYGSRYKFVQCSINEQLMTTRDSLKKGKK